MPAPAASHAAEPSDGGRQRLPLLGFHGIHKHFGPVEVLHGVSFTLTRGRIVALLGENGAGKSTLMKIAAGQEQPSAGELRLEGERIRFDGPRAAEAAGIVLIHQEFNLAEDLTIAQNLYLGHELRRGPWLDDAAMRAGALRVLAQVGLARDPATPVRALITAEKQLVEIARALSRPVPAGRSRLLIMDEPTATLTPAETERLFSLMRQLQADGATIVFISHKLDEVERFTAAVLVMRDGRFVARAATAQLSRAQMARLMVGRELSDLYPPPLPAPAAGAAPLLQVQGLTVAGWADGVSFHLQAGEILGFAGLVGAGRTELFEGLLGLRPRTSGVIMLDGKRIDPRSPREAARLGITYLSEDRKGKGLHVHLGLAANLTLMDLPRYARPWLRPADESKALAAAVDTYGLRTGSLAVNAAALSGGNQQKLALAKVLQPQPRIVVLDEPTRGVDIGAKRDLYLLIHQLAQQGCAVVVISAELVERIGLCHRGAVRRAGRLHAVLPREQLDEAVLIAHATVTVEPVAEVH